MTEVKAYTMIVIITDTIDINEYQFKITVTNLPPYKTSVVVTPVTLIFGQAFYYTLPESKDPEGLLYTTTIQNGPSYA